MFIRAGLYPTSQEIHVKQGAGSYFHITSFNGRVIQFRVLRFIIFRIIGKIYQHSKRFWWNVDHFNAIMTTNSRISTIQAKWSIIDPVASLPLRNNTHTVASVHNTKSHYELRDLRGKSGLFLDIGPDLDQVPKSGPFCSHCITVHIYSMLYLHHKIQMIVFIVDECIAWISQMRGRALWWLLCNSTSSASILNATHQGKHQNQFSVKVYFAF